METAQIINILNDEKTFFDKQAKANRELKLFASTKGATLYHKGKEQAYQICSDCIKDVIDLLNEVLKVEEEQK